MSILGSTSAATPIIDVAGMVSPNAAPCARPYSSHLDMSVTYIPVRTTSARPPPSRSRAPPPLATPFPACAPRPCGRPPRRPPPAPPPRHPPPPPQGGARRPPTQTPPPQPPCCTRPPAPTWSASRSSGSRLHRLQRLFQGECSRVQRLADNGP